MAEAEVEKLRQEVATASHELSDLLVHRQPGLVVRDHEPPRKENQPAPCGNGLIVMVR